MNCLDIELHIILYFTTTTVDTHLYLLKTAEYLLLLLHSPSYGFTGWSIPQQEGPLLTSGCCPSLSVGHGLCCDCHGNPQCRLQRFTGRVLYGGVVLLLRHDSCGVFPGRHSSLQLPAHILGQPYRHMCCLRNAHVSHVFRCNSDAQLGLLGFVGC